MSSTVSEDNGFARLPASTLGMSPRTIEYPLHYRSARRNPTVPAYFYLLWDIGSANLKKSYIERLVPHFAPKPKLLVYTCGVLSETREVTKGARFTKKQHNHITMRRATDGFGLDITTTSPEVVVVLDHFTQQVLSYGRQTDQLSKMEEHSILTDALCAIGTLAGERKMTSDKLETAKFHIQRAKKMKGTEREELYIQTAESLLEHDAFGATDCLEEVVQRWPTDVLAVKLAQEFYFNRGDSVSLLRIAEKSRKNTPDNLYIHGMTAFGLVENGRYEEAERLALLGDSMTQGSDAWSHHAFAHVCIRFMEKRSDSWSSLCSFVYSHNWWHSALFHLELEDYNRTFSIFDDRLWKDAKDCCQDQIGAVSLLWRLELRDVPVGDRWEDLTDHISHKIKDHIQPYIDMHYVYALAKAGKEERLEEMMKSLEEEKPHREHDLTVETAKALSAHARGNPEKCYEHLQPVRDRLKHLGGSNAQLDVIEQTYLDTLMKTFRFREASSILNERYRSRPTSRYVKKHLERAKEGMGCIEEDVVRL
ncbi:hypothetical protein PROFUN_02925 [Planoprotostelium fungivorum]|uniref:Tetratricopeptide repeat protein 38 n=1 Tax=Planoprotostelium fungivorum TaxID=1890364 RepID=A0A2P6NS44_9EUKA|nr:hypothetical protein PROFUN_02925 [Planoprotostelium fungivorum]